jgi:8-oxo-dGTP pyrophosphatase MutT (NUDIX family)
MAVTRSFASEVSPEFDAFARRWVEAGSPVAQTRLAATVLLVRDGPRGPEVFMQRRASTMAFAPSMVVFPGGRVDPADAEASIDDQVVAAAAARMRMPSADTRAILAAAVREVEEECGVTVDAGDLRCRARWITPEVEPRRYDTWFFATRMPAGQEAIGTTTETEAEGWGHPADILALAARGELRLMPPTIVSLEQLASFDTVEAFLADEPPLDLVEPTLVLTPRGYVLESRIP